MSIIPEWVPGALKNSFIASTEMEGENPPIERCCENCGCRITGRHKITDWNGNEFCSDTCLNEWYEGGMNDENAD